MADVDRKRGEDSGVDPLSLFALALALLAIGLQLSPDYHNALLSWIFLGLGIVLLMVGAARAALTRTRSQSSDAPRQPMSEEWRMVLAAVGGALFLASRLSGDGSDDGSRFRLGRIPLARTLELIWGTWQAVR